MRTRSTILEGGVYQHSWWSSRNIDMKCPSRPGTGLVFVAPSKYIKFKLLSSRLNLWRICLPPPCLSSTAWAGPAAKISVTQSQYEVHCAQAKGPGSVLSFETGGHRGRRRAGLRGGGGDRGFRVGGRGEGGVERWSNVPMGNFPPDTIWIEHLYLRVLFPHIVFQPIFSCLKVDKAYRYCPMMLTQ